MALYEPFEDGVEANGETVRSMIHAFPDSLQGRAEDILAKNGIEDPRDDEWYPQEAWLDAVAEIDETMGENTMKEIGRQIPDNADWPPGVDSVVGALASINEAYHMNHRGGEIGYYEAEQVDGSEVEVRCRNPYACAMDQGIIESVVAEFAGERASIEEVSDRCRSDGGEECVYRVTAR